MRNCTSRCSGQFPWKYLPTVPAEMIYFPQWSFFNLNQLSSWSRAMLVPLAIVNHFKPTRLLPDDQQCSELYPAGTASERPRSVPATTMAFLAEFLPGL